MTEIFNAVIYNPINWVLLFLYHNASFGDLGIAIILLTVVIRLVLMPLFYKSAKNQTILQRLQPHIKKIQLDHKDNKEKQAKAMMALYKEHRISPFSGFLPLILQLPVFIALFEMFTTGITSGAFDNPTFFGLDLAAKSLVLAVIAALLQYFQTRIAMPSLQGVDGTQKAMMFIGPVITVLILGGLPAALSLYWSVSNLFSLGQQFYINKKLPSLPDQTPKPA